MIDPRYPESPTSPDGWDVAQEQADQPREWSVTCYIDVRAASLEEASDIAARIVSALGTDERYPELVNAERSDIYENEVI